MCSVMSQIRPALCDLPGFSVHEILQARILEWVAISSSRGSSDPEMEPISLVSPALAGIGRHWQADSLPLSHLGSPQNERMKQSKKGQ